MVIDRSNYELWIIDWLDGNLNDLQTSKLLSFLDENPDLSEEMGALSSARLIRPAKSFSGKDLLKKTDTELPYSQFEYLSLAHLEHDLNAEQEKELLEITSHSPERKKLFDPFQRIVLIPPAHIFSKKENLKKKTTGQKILRLSVRGLAAAATITLIITVYLLIPRSLSYDQSTLTEKMVIDTFTINPVSPILSINSGSINKKVIKNTKKETVIDSDINKDIPPTDILMADIINRSDLKPDTEEIKIILTSGLMLQNVFELSSIKNNYHLIAYNLEIIAASDNEERSRLGKFLALTFRNLLLKDKKANDHPLKGYEIAEGGINGLNKLLGWEMALQKTNDEKGELQSLYFSSRILKFNAPVKKAEPVQ